MVWAVAAFVWIMFALFWALLALYFYRKANRCLVPCDSYLDLRDRFWMYFAFGLVPFLSIDISFNNNAAYKRAEIQKREGTLSRPQYYRGW